jgi:ubiquinone/menaquinone biosynthesis C-methylase UbiE
MLTTKIFKQVQTAVNDLRFGAILRGNVSSKYSHLGAVGTENSDYNLLSVLFEHRIRPGDVLVDIGCGKGRVLNSWLDHHSSHQIYGIELDPTIAEKTRLRLRHYNNVKILSGDACLLLPDEGSLFYLFNPFDAAVMGRFIGAILKKPKATNGLLRRVLYHNCLHLELFEKNRCFSVQPVASLYPLQSALIECTNIVD